MGNGDEAVLSRVRALRLPSSVKYAFFLFATSKRRNPCQPVAFAAEEWAEVLLLAHKYLMDGIELSALRQLRDALPPLDTVELMVVAQTVGSEELYQVALQALAQRDQMLSLSEAQRIGLGAFYDVVVHEHVYFSHSRRPL